jgi:lipoyl(octanoyl) transferase
LVKLFASDGLFFPAVESAPVEWAVSEELVPYPEALDAMEKRVEAIIEGRANELVWLVEHPPLYTGGISAKAQDLLFTDRFPVYSVGRGGQYTYHGPGQRVVYVMVDLSRRRKDVRCFVAALERWIIDTLATFGVIAETRSGRTGVWVSRPEKGQGVEDKIAAIGLRLRRWVSFHGISINVHPNLEHYRGIVSCGIRDQGVTSLLDLGYEISMPEVDMALGATFSRHFGRKYRDCVVGVLPGMVSRER